MSFGDATNSIRRILLGFFNVYVDVTNGIDIAYSAHSYSTSSRSTLISGVRRIIDPCRAGMKNLLHTSHKSDRGKPHACLQAFA